jgi:hypothetical protein
MFPNFVTNLRIRILKDEKILSKVYRMNAFFDFWYSVVPAPAPQNNEALAALAPDAAPHYFKACLKLPVIQKKSRKHSALPPPPP